MTKKKTTVKEIIETSNERIPIYIGIIENDETDKIVTVNSSYKLCIETTAQDFNDTKDNSIRIEKWENGKLVKTYEPDIHFMDDEYDNMFVIGDAIFLFPDEV